MHARVADHHPETTFHTVSLGRWVNTTQLGSSGCSERKLSASSSLLLRQRGQDVAVEAEEIVRVVAVLEPDYALPVLR